MTRNPNRKLSLLQMLGLSVFLTAVAVYSGYNLVEFNLIGCGLILLFAYAALRSWIYTFQILAGTAKDDD